MKRIYMDYAATTPLDPDAAVAMRPYLEEVFGNPSSLYRTGRDARRALDDARDRLAAILGADSPREIIFTSGGSEADNLALKGVAWALEKQGRHIVTSQIEHHAVLHAAAFLADRGFEVTYVEPSGDGVIEPGRVRDAMRDDTILVSVMHANNETGVIQPIEEIAKIAREQGALFHTDAVQTVGHIPVNVREIDCDLLSLSAHKFYGPRGVGALYVKRRTPIVPLIHGGGQEHELRAGTEYVAGAVGMATALELAVERMHDEAERLAALRDRLAGGLLELVPGITVNGHSVRRLAGHINVSIYGVEGESVLLNLDMKGIEASSGSACTSGSIEASHVLLAMGLDRRAALGSVRFTLGRHTTADEVEEVLVVLPQIIDRLRSAHSDSGRATYREREGKG